jgi:hypothetical protein
MAKCSKLGEIIPKTMEQRFKSLSLFEFQERFSNAADCLKYLADEKWGNGFVCRKCGHTHSCAGKATQSRQCTCCRYVESPTAQTLFHKVKFDLLKAFYIVYFVSTNKKGITSTELSRKLNLRQKTCWGFKRKVMKAMESSENHPIEGDVEVDETVFGGQEENTKGRKNINKKLVVQYPDKNFPTDVRENTGFYGDNDFVGEFHGASAAAGPAVGGSGFMRGFVKGWGYGEFTTKNLSGFGLDATLYETGSITGKFVGEGLPSLDNFSGLGRTFSIGSGLSTGGNWEGYDGTGTTIWKGSFEGFSIGLPQLKGSGGGIRTETKLLFPTKTDDNEN